MATQLDHKAQIIDGKRIAEAIKAEVSDAASEMLKLHHVQPCLVVVRVGEDPASAVYVRNKVRTSEQIGFRSKHHALEFETTTIQLLELLDVLNRRDDVDGILVQLPLPPHIDEEQVLESIDPAKDVDGFHPINIGRLARGRETLVPCTPAGIIELLKRSDIKIAGRHACVVGRSHIVGRPVAQLLLQHDATVTICHSRTVDLQRFTSQADILIVAIGRAGFIRGEHVKPGATVIDVGMNNVTSEEEARFLFAPDELEKRLEAIRRQGYTLVGDVHPAEVALIAGRLTPVPGGVGPLTVAMLMRNTLVAAARRRNLLAA